MSRPIFPHPGKIMTEAQARQRYVRPGTILKARGHLPYSQHVQLALTGDGPFNHPVTPLPGESAANLTARLQAASQLGPSASKTVALALLGNSFDHAARKTIWTAELLAHRDTHRFNKNPSPVRGDLAACTDSAALLRIFPSVAVNLSSLENLEWSEDLRPSDIKLLWLMIAWQMAATDTVLKSHQLAMGISRPSRSIEALSGATFQLRDHPKLPDTNGPCLVDGRVNPRLIDMIRPVAGGENYGYLELCTISKITSTWQERALRHILGAAVRGRQFWERGGVVYWELELAELFKIFSMSGNSLDRLRKERVVPFTFLLDGDRSLTNLDAMVHGSRLSADLIIVRDERAQGRPASAGVLQVTVLSARAKEVSESEYAKERTSYRRKQQPKHTLLQGLSTRLTAAELTQARSNAAKRAWAQRRGKPLEARFVPPEPKGPSFDILEEAQSTRQPGVDDDLGHYSDFLNSLILDAGK